MMAQDFHYVTSFHAPQVVNPAGTSANALHRTQVVAQYRGQWDAATSEQAYQGVSVYVDMRFCLPNSRKSFYALGVGMQRDGSTRGGLYHGAANAALAYHQHLGGETFAAAGAAAGGLVFGIQPARLRFDAQYQQGAFDPSRPTGEAGLQESILQADLHAGLLLYNNRKGWSAGLAWRHLNKPLYSLLGEENRLGIGLVIQGSATVWSSYAGARSLVLRTILRRQSVSGGNSLQWQWLGGGTFQLGIPSAGRLSLGTYLRTGSTPTRRLRLNTLVPTLQWSGEYVTIILTYDADVAGTRSRYPGGMELMFGYSFGKKDRCVVCSGF
ncbi:MAG: hypothetical protein RLY31_1033 [Bacteroidota bacterium]|jgi:hypothetical protein